ncbi:hypothetical protein E2C01_065320 [Portunus trituberculatus]|uniref:Uncharacterized protein n=1 Tax=Portunus trituberculatus TaxID=210409 RepID=A0A5B7HII9_PORTR|nr:hypothetical protein [Portunus trituberculatus]
MPWPRKMRWSCTMNSQTRSS